MTAVTSSAYRRSGNPTSGTRFAAPSPCVERSCTVTPTRFGGALGDGVSGGTPDGIVVGTTRSESGTIACPGGSDTDSDVWVARWDGAGLVGLRCFRGTGNPTPRSVDGRSGHLVVAGRTAPSDLDYAGATELGAASGGSDGFVFVLDATTFERVGNFRVVSGAADTATLRPDGCLLVAGVSSGLQIVSTQLATP